MIYDRQKNENILRDHPITIHVVCFYTNIKHTFCKGNINLPEYFYFLYWQSCWMEDEGTGQF
jgi:hypothetical protein